MIYCHTAKLSNYLLVLVNMLPLFDEDRCSYCMYNVMDNEWLLICESVLNYICLFLYV